MMRACEAAAPMPLSAAFTPFFLSLVCYMPLATSVAALA